MADDDNPWRGLRGPIREVPALQTPGYDEVTRKVRFPDLPGGDRRLYLDIPSLERLLAVARSSPTMRVVIHGAQLEVEQRRAPGGHVYEVWTVEGSTIVPEWTGAEQTLLAKRGG